MAEILNKLPASDRAILKTIALVALVAFKKLSKVGLYIEPYLIFKVTRVSLFCYCTISQQSSYIWKARYWFNSQFIATGSYLYAGAHSYSILFDVCELPVRFPEYLIPGEVIQFSIDNTLFVDQFNGGTNQCCELWCTNFRLILKSLPGTPPLQVKLYGNLTNNLSRWKFLSVEFLIFLLLKPRILPFLQC